MASRRMKRQFTLLIILGIIQLPMYACSCWGGPFFEVITYDSIIVVGKVTARNDHGFKLKIEETLVGEVSSKKIQVWGDVGHLCRVYASTFEVGQTYVFALQHINKIYEGLNFPPEKVGDWEISVCGTHYLKVEGKDVIGDLGDGAKRMSLQDLKDQLGVPPPIQARISVNPLQQSLSINLINPPEDAWEVQLYDLHGKACLPTLTQFPENTTVRIDTHTLPPGAYILYLRHRGSTWVRKVAIYTR